MLIIRRVYAYLLTLVGLALMCGAAANLGQLFVDVLVRASFATNDLYVRDTVARNGAAALVGSVVWVLHWRWIGHLAERSVEERRSTLRGVFLYLVVAGATLVVAGSARDILEAVLGAMLGSGVRSNLASAVLRPVPFLVVGALVAVAHWRVGAIDRARASEGGGTATLRRWYLYGGAFLAVAALEASLQSLVANAWRLVVEGPNVTVEGVVESAPTALVSLVVWLALWRVLPDRRADEAATLRSVYLFGGSALGITGALLGCSQVLYYGLARALGVDHPGGAELDIRAAIGDPVAAGVVYGAGWAYFRRALRDHADAFAEARGAIGVARLYRYLVALLAMSIAAAGVGGLLWSLGDIVTGMGDATPSGIRDRLALFATLVIVAGPVWPVHWRPAPADQSEMRSLARRLYLYLSVIAAALTLVGCGAVVLYRVFGLVLGGATAADVKIDLTHALALAIVGAVVAAYHARMLRADAERDRRLQRAPEPRAEPAIVSMTVHLSAADVGRLDSALAALRAMDVQVTVLDARPPA